MNDNLKKVFSNNFNYWLNKKNTTQKDLSEALNISSSTISDWSTGKKFPRIEKIQLLADYFNINKADLLTENKNEVSSLLLDMILKQFYKKKSELELSNYDIAKKLDLDVKEISIFENSLNLNSKFDFIQKFSNEYNVSIDYFFKSENDIQLTKSENSLIINYRKLKNPNKKEVDNFVKFKLEQEKLNI